MAGPDRSGIEWLDGSVDCAKLVLAKVTQNRLATSHGQRTVVKSMADLSKPLERNISTETAVIRLRADK